jgi:hypothetical protein
VPPQADAQGSLTPPGAPSPTFKTLSQIEPRFAVSSAGFHITNSGSYYLTDNLTNSGFSGGIVISASDVTLDLNGFTLFGGPGSGEGINVDDGLRNVTLMNGTVRGWGDYGVRAFRAFAVECRNIRALGNISGLGLSTNGVARECLSRDNSSYGIYAASGSVVEHCTISDNGADGIQAESRCALVDNYLSGNNTNLMNNSAAISLFGVGSRVEGNQIVNNYLTGVKDFFGGNFIVRNTARANAVTNFDISASSALGPLISSPGVITNSNPWANFSF